MNEYSVGLLRTGDRPVAEPPLPDITQHSQDADNHAAGEIRTRNPSKRATADRCLRPRLHCDRQPKALETFIYEGVELESGRNVVGTSP